MTPQRLSASVLLAAYNGERYIEKQVRSIFEQSRVPDEIVVLDDRSTDATTEHVRRLAAEAPCECRLVGNAARKGYARNFVEGLRHARGDVIFFADQDDVWRPNKIERVLETFANTGAQCVSHDFSVFYDGGAQPIMPSYFSVLKQNGLPPSVCVKGCALAFRRELAERALMRTETGANVSHDVWIALAAHLLVGRVYIHEPLIDHRLHDANASGWIVRAPVLSRLRRVWGARANVVADEFRAFLRYHVGETELALAERILSAAAASGHCVSGATRAGLAARARLMHLRRLRGLHRLDGAVRALARGDYDVAGSPRGFIGDVLRLRS